MNEVSFVISICHQHVCPNSMHFLLYFHWIKFKHSSSISKYPLFNFLAGLIYLVWLHYDYMIYVTLKMLPVLFFAIRIHLYISHCRQAIYLCRYVPFEIIFRLHSNDIDISLKKNSFKISSYFHNVIFDIKVFFSLIKKKNWVITIHYHRHRAENSLHANISSSLFFYILSY